MYWFYVKKTACFPNWQFCCHLHHQCYCFKSINTNLTLHCLTYLPIFLFQSSLCVHITVEAGMPMNCLQLLRSNWKAKPSRIRIGWGTPLIHSEDGLESTSMSPRMNQQFTTLVGDLHCSSGDVLLSWSAHAQVSFCHNDTFAWCFLFPSFHRVSVFSFLSQCYMWLIFFRNRSPLDDVSCCFPWTSSSVGLWVFVATIPKRWWGMGLNESIDLSPVLIYVAPTYVTS